MVGVEGVVVGERMPEYSRGKVFGNCELQLQLRATEDSKVPLHV